VPALVTGAAGFVGTHLMKFLARDGVEAVGTSLDERPRMPSIDVRDAHAVEELVARVQPTRVFHLAAQSSAALSWREPGMTYEINVTGTHNLLDALRVHAPRCRVLLACTSDEYGRLEPEQCPVDENAPLRPVSPYAASKVAAEWVGRMFFESFGMKVVITRAFMHIGPGQPASFATADWARQIARAEAGFSEPVVSVGNVELRREFGDVRDVVRAYRAILDEGRPGDAYNVATGRAAELGEALDILRKLSNIDVDVVIDSSKIRPADPPLLEGSAAKLAGVTGWAPEHRLEDTLAEVLDFWRKRVSERGAGA
jgi:GDP-4-dehydro-6-deoxy-D-mannose reductase